MKTKKRFEKDRLRKGIYILPNLSTTLNIFCGFYAVIASSNGNFTAAAFAIIIAGIFDMLDGKIARATKSTSQFGVEYDSLADLISFGMAPGFMIYLWALKPMGRIGWLAGFLFMVCGALRLARFNTQVGLISSKHFIGLPIPAAAGVCATTVLFFNKIGLASQAPPVLVLIMLYTLAFLMVSTIKYYSFKKMKLFKKKNFNTLVTVVLILIFIAAQPSIALFMIGTVYLASGPFTVIYRHFRSSSKEKGIEEARQESSVSVDKS